MNTQVTWKDTVEYISPITEGIVVKVYDGDTITIASKMPYPDSPLFRFHVRLDGIDTPEIKSKTVEEKNIAKEARDALSSICMNKRITLQNVKNEKYGRILADVYCENVHLNEWLISQRYAVKYSGGTKVSPSSWSEYKTSGKL
jgi:micrococcal nuclease